MIEVIIVDNSVLSWSSFPPKSSKFTAINLTDDVTLRSNVFDDNIVATCPKAWTVSQAVEWLNIHPISL